MSIKVKKRNGSTENFNIEKIHRVINWAIKDLSNVSLTDVEINAKININDGVTTKEIHKLLIESAANLISIEKPNYQYVAGRL
ncbi:MAG: ribonucleotide-diphosphate reductase subunit alpha, partial [Caulobacteraceae bacterium]|nr:ribonucleotide-diphosphate reductase subunit alpha [Caulobacteraceae bacterium]